MNLYFSKDELKKLLCPSGVFVRTEKENDRRIFRKEEKKSDLYPLQSGCGLQMLLVFKLRCTQLFQLGYLFVFLASTQFRSTVFFSF
ncbi:MAG: hypothetical protein CMN32_04765 [Saprospirales bacterium]|nr:hypothetical protein [Saprospirales bacterium]